jgi:hypothetical protein
LSERLVTAIVAAVVMALSNSSGGFFGAPEDCLSGHIA